MTNYTENQIREVKRGSHCLFCGADLRLREHLLFREYRGQPVKDRQPVCDERCYVAAEKRNSNA